MTTNEISQRLSDWEPERDRGGNDRGHGTRSAQRLAEYERLREKCPVAWTNDLGGYWSLMRYDDVATAATNFGSYRSGQPFVALPDGGTHVPISLNPPVHTVYRRMLNRYFTAARIDALEPVMREYVTQLLDPVVEAGAAEFVSAVCQPLPARALATLLNLPDSATAELLGQFAQLNELGWDLEKVGPIIFGVFSTHIAKVVAERREHPLDPDSDLLSGAIAMEIDGEPLDDDTVIQIGVQMIAAGHATTADALGAAVYRLATDIDLQTRLRAHPELIPMAIEEILRLETPIPDIARRAAGELDVGGRTIAEGDLISLNFSAANRDPEMFTHPDACMIDRSPNKHLAFGHGVHKCLGAPLARLELKVALEELLSRTAEIELGGAPEAGTSLILNGFAKLPVRVTPSQPR